MFNKVRGLDKIGSVYEVDSYSMSMKVCTNFSWNFFSEL